MISRSKISRLKILETQQCMLILSSKINPKSIPMALKIVNSSFTVITKILSSNQDNKQHSSLVSSQSFPETSLKKFRSNANHLSELKSLTLNSMELLLFKTNGKHKEKLSSREYLKLISQTKFDKS